MTLWQGSPNWRDVKLGKGNATIGRAGCLLVCLTEAIRLLANRSQLLPTTVNDTAIAAEAYVGSLIVLDKAARAYGLTADARDKVELPLSVGNRQPLIDGIKRALGAGLGIIHIDHDSETPGGDVDGDHFILATCVDALGVVCLDPALAKETRLLLPTLTADVKWGAVPKHYKALCVRPIKLLPT